MIQANEASVFSCIAEGQSRVRGHIPRSISMLFCCSVFLVDLAVSAGDAKDTASKHFEKGVNLFKNEDFSAAHREFEAAYEAQPHFAVRYNLAMCLWKLKKYGEAADQIQCYLSEGGRHGKEI